MKRARFKVEIPHRPIYVGGSGPKMAPLRLAPVHDKNEWEIVEVVELDSLPQYVIAFKENPVHRRAVKKEHILNWVSQRTWEDFDYEQAASLMADEEDEENKKLLKKEYLKNKSEARQKRFQQTTIGEAGQGRKRRMESVVKGLAVPNSVPETDEEIQSGAEDPGIASEDELTVEILKGKGKPARGRLIGEPSKSMISSEGGENNPPRSSKASQDASSIPKKTLGPTVKSLPPTILKARPSWKKASLEIHEEVEHRSKRIIKNPVSEPTTTTSTLLKEGSKSSATPGHTPKSNKKLRQEEEVEKGIEEKEGDDDEEEGEEEEEEEEDEEQWAVKTLLDDKKRQVKGKKVQFYLVDWVGEWDPSWEPEDNIAQDVIHEYWLKKNNVSIRKSTDKKN